MSALLRSVIIVGGGTAGWLTAGIIAARHRETVQITLVESETIGIVGVGEGTWPTMRTTLKKMGVSKPISSASATPRSSRARSSRVG